MTTPFEELKKIYLLILDLDLKIKSVIQTEEFGKLTVLLNKKDVLIREAEFIKDEATFEENEKEELKLLVAKIREIEENNIQMMLDKKQEISEKIAETYQGSKMLSAYKITNEEKPKLLDIKE